MLLALIAVVAAIAFVAFLVAFRGDLRKHSLTVGVRSPVELRDLPAELLQHIRETDYIWREVTGAYVGVLERGFGRHFAISWEPDANRLTLTQEQDLRIGGSRAHRNACSEQIVFSNKNSDLRDETDNEIRNQMRMQHALPRTQAR